MRLAFFRLLWFALGAMLALVLLEAVLRLLPVTMGVYRTAQFDRWPLLGSEPGQPYANSDGWAMSNAHQGITNNYGHIAPFDYKKNSRPVVVMGDSFIESLMNDYKDTLQGQLGRKLGTSASVYGLGVSGLSASEYVALSRMARDEFNPVAAIFLITDGDFSESIGPRLGHYFLVPDGNSFKMDYAPIRDQSGLKKLRMLIGDLSIYRYFQVNLQFSLTNIFKVFDQQNPSQLHPVALDKKPDAPQKVADWLLAELPPALGLPPECIVLLMDSDRYAIYNAQSASPRKDSPKVWQHFITEAEQLGFKVRDLDHVFRQLYAQDHVKFDHWPTDRHWNKVGHGVGADEAYRLLFAEGTPTQRTCKMK